ncbi:macoilin-like isoform X2 [Liolophura sinensis]|uniref:macoilin-like isoform X2 n=1 Tax=Liolophura sinensis TaxID=3198878 RepID=UPI0031582CAF
MKRPRNAECGKLRRPLKRSKITEGIYGSTFLYLKFLLVWALVLMADFILEFRFEYLWPFWLLLRSVYDSFKYQGLAFSVFFVCIAVTSDVICYLFIPVQWLFFAASTYVWVQYVWHTERGICLPTVSLWLLFVYIEASVRLRELKSLPFNLDLCRPFAAHCIGYPVVTLGFGFKSYVSYRMRLRKQKDVQKENDFYIQLLQKALPQELQNSYTEQKALTSKTDEEVISNGTTGKRTSKSTDDDKEGKKSSKATDDDDDIDFYIEQTPPVAKKSNVNELVECSEQNLANDQQQKAFKASSSSLSSSKTSGNKLNSSKDNTSKKGKNYSKDLSPATFSNNKDEVISRLETDIKRLKADLQASRNCEQELRSQINSLSIGDKSMKSELYQLQQDNESLQNKLHNLVTSRQQDKQNLAILERKLQEERKSRAVLEQQLAIERKAKKAEEAAAARAVAMAAAARGECTESCKNRRRDIENDMKQLRRDLKVREDQFRQKEREVQALRQYKEAQSETEVLMSALAAMQDKNAHLENNLSAETRLKLDLFSALGEAKRQIEIQQGLLGKKEMEIDDLKSKIAEVMACAPSSTYNGITTSDSPPLYSSNFRETDVISKSTLNPNASDYTPKTTV